VRWPLEARDVVLGSTLTLSNEVTSSPVRVAAMKGMAVVLVYPV
jgi:thiamine pyrophosphokinase